MTYINVLHDTSDKMSGLVENPRFPAEIQHCSDTWALI